MEETNKAGKRLKSLWYLDPQNGFWPRQFRKFLGESERMLKSLPPEESYYHEIADAFEHSDGKFFPKHIERTTPLGVQHYFLLGWSLRELSPEELRVKPDFGTLIRTEKGEQQVFGGKEAERFRKQQLEGIVDVDSVAPSAKSIWLKAIAVISVIVGAGYLWFWRRNYLG